MNKKESSFYLLDSTLQRWVWQQGWTSLNEVQEKSIPIILKQDSDVIISAATAGGKTEAAFLPILSSIKNDLSNGCKVLYISPLKALINDQYRRLKELAVVTKTSVTPWHQDVSLSKKKRFLEIPTNVLIITPESLESFLINKRGCAESIFSTLKYIVIDELHAFIGTERGKQLQSLLSRIEILTSREIPRVAMSATFSDFENVVKYLHGNRVLNCNIVKEEYSSHEVRILIKEYIETEGANILNEISNEIISKLRGSNNLVFVNSKIDAENYAINLKGLCKVYNLPNEFRIHHGNLSKELREGVEHELQKGLYPVTAICTSTMELGVDIGKVKSIAQIGVANSVSSLRQRLGRSGRRNEPSCLRIFSIDENYYGSPTSLCEFREKLFQNIAVVELLKDKKFESFTTNKYHFSTLIHQVLSLVASYGSVYPKEAYEVLCKNGAFDNIDSVIFGKILRSLGENKLISQMDSGEIVVGVIGERLINKTDFYSVFYSAEEYTVIDIDGGRIGVVQVLPPPKAVITLGARNWCVKNVDRRKKVIYVSIINKQGCLMFDGNIPEVSSMITNKMKELYSSDEIYQYLDARAKIEVNRARTYFRYNKFYNADFVQIENSEILFTWAGSVINYTIGLIAKFYMDIFVDFENQLAEENMPLMVDGSHPIYVRNINKSNVLEIIKRGKPNALNLAMLLPRERKVQEKYDNLLSDELLNIGYAQSNIDVEGAWRVLEACVK